jgi:glycosyltransferase involved in cell wall biosynthesis
MMVEVAAELVGKLHIVGGVPEHLVPARVWAAPETNSMPEPFEEGAVDQRSMIARRISQGGPAAVVEKTTEGIDHASGAESPRHRSREALASAAGTDWLQGDGTALDRLVPCDTQAPGPMVSILIPTYRQERYIAKAVASALAQDYPYLEVVVIDDHSPDGTGEVVRHWSFDPRLRYMRNSHNRGRVANYRYALTELARGEWILMLDGDDFLSNPAFIRRAVEAIDRHHDRPIVFAQAGHRTHFLQGNASDADILPPINGIERVMGGGEYLRFVFETGFFTHLGTLYHKTRAINIGFYTAEISSSDMDSLLRLALEGEVLLLNTIAGCWVQHGANASSNLPLEEFLPNVRLFRRIARRAVERELTTWPQIEGPLSRYEARTLTHLFRTTIGKTSHGPLALVRFLAIGLRVNARLFGDRLFLSRCLGFARTLAGLSAKRSRLGRVAARGFRGLRERCHRLLRL